METKKLSLNNEISIIKKKVEDGVDEINKYKSSAAENTQKMRDQRTKLSMILMAVNNIYAKCGSVKLTPKSPLRSIDRELFDNQKCLYDDFDFSKSVAVEQLKVIKAILDDHKKTYAQLHTDSKTKEFIKHKRDKHELSHELAIKFEEIINAKNKRQHSLKASVTMIEKDMEKTAVK